jgi:hypothetical protein
MAQINKPNEYFNTVLWTGNNTTNTPITGVGFQPDLNWIKKRSSAGNNFLTDAVRGVGRHLNSENTNAENVYSEGIKSFDSDGFTLGSGSDINESSQTYVGWNWLASNTTASNTDGSITSTVSANTTSGFSIATYTGNNTNAQTIGHGLGVAPKVYIIKRRDSTSAWGMYHGSLGANKYLQLESTNQEATDTGIWNNTAPTSSVLSIGNAGYFNNASGGTYVCYAFAEKKGYSKFGSYEGNGNVDGPFIYLGFKPAFVIIKKYSAANDWHTHDNKRDTFNPETRYLQPNTSAVETNDTGKALDFLSNGFKLRTTHGSHNGATGQFFIYMAFAEEPLVGDNPATAR